MSPTDLAVRKTITVNAPVDTAFRVFTDGIDRWWFRGHKIGPADLKRAVLEGRPGGRWYEIDVDGSECDWGRVLEWDPPHRLVLAWQIDGAFKYDPDLVTEVEVRFHPEDGGRTRVELEHRNLDRMGAAMEQVRAAFDAPGGWSGLLEAFASAAAASREATP